MQSLCDEISPKKRGGGRKTKEEKTWRKVGFKPRMEEASDKLTAD